MPVQTIHQATCKICGAGRSFGDPSEALHWLVAHEEACQEHRVYRADESRVPLADRPTARFE